MSEMKQYDILNYGNPIEIVRGRRGGCKAENPCIRFNHSTRNGGNTEYVKIDVSHHIRRDFEGKKLEIVSLGKSYAIVPENNGRFYLSGSTICGGTSATYSYIEESIKDCVDEHGSVDVVKINNAYIFPHIPITKEER